MTMSAANSERDPNAGAGSLLVIDEPIEGDQRVMAARASLPPPVLVVDLRNPIGTAWTKGFRDLFKLLARSLITAPWRYRRVRGLLRGHVSDSAFAGSVAACRWLIRATRTANRLKKLATERPPTVIHANDLYCALAAALVEWPRETRLIYDSHEFQIHRNRKAGWARILLEHALESFVISRAHEIRVVNHAIAKSIAEIHRVPDSRIRVIHNDFYKHRPMPSAPVTGRPAIVYVGRGVRGRCLEDLARPAGELPFDVHTFLLGDEIPRSLDARAWTHNSDTDPKESLEELVASRRALMWCCLDANSLSYSLALPNKFFQAMALGIPIVASEGTYLADIVRQHGIGVVYDAQGLDTLAARIASTEFQDWSEAVSPFREQLWAGQVTV
jgi:glycosyltransferase involved in cell wall biosynthesis